jgi:hypothetical protein
MLSPIGLLFSLIGLTKRPRGLAIAGTILGALGSVWLVFAGFAMVAGFAGLKKAVNTAAGIVNTQAAGQLAADAIDQERARLGGSLPSESAGNELIKRHLDAWKHPLRYKPSGTTFTLVSDGPDGKPDSDDDIKFTESQLRTAAAAATQNSAEGDAGNPASEPAEQK